MQRRFLEFAVECLETVPIQLRDHSAIMMATHSSKIPGAKKIIDKFRYELCAYLEDCETRDTVYSFSAALVPIVHPSKGELK
jgi:hypothetical protein